MSFLQRSQLHFLVVLVLHVSTALADKIDVVKCVEFEMQRQLSKKLDAVTDAQPGGADNATNKRGETKIANKAERAKSAHDELRAQGFANRDKVRPGTVNVTRTLYYDKLKMLAQVPARETEAYSLVVALRNGTIKKKDLTAEQKQLIVELGLKFRSRLYGYRNAGTTDPMTPTNKFRVKGLADKDADKIVSFEFKYDDIADESSVNKSLIAMWADDEKLIMKDLESFNRNRGAVRARLLSLAHQETGKPINDPKLVDAMLDFVGTVHTILATPEMKVAFPRGLEPDLIIEYTRNALEKTMMDPVTGAKVRLQVTQDTNIHYYDAKTGKEVDSPYLPDDTVTEYKEPLTYKNIPDEEMKTRFPELYETRRIIRGLQAEQVPHIKAGSGKSSSKDRLRYQETEDGGEVLPPPSPQKTHPQEQRTL